jgi:Ca2+/Na+ antiporter
MQSAMAKEAEMLAVIFIVTCLSVFGFYVYVLVRLRREEKREDAHKKRLPEHLYEMGPDLHQDDAENRQDPDFLRIGKSIRHKSHEAEARLRRETMVGVGLTVGGLAAVLAGIEFLNSLVTWLHWY